MPSSRLPPPCVLLLPLPPLFLPPTPTLHLCPRRRGRRSHLGTSEEFVRDGEEVVGEGEQGNSCGLRRKGPGRQGAQAVGIAASGFRILVTVEPARRGRGGALRRHRRAWPWPPARGGEGKKASAVGVLGLCWKL